ncbi:GPI inositol-deacylase [Copidosoma floridanum]|uniref:GPI inositol-deacylase n=1 Tax=Copidosoma floridanum TaxID=29053 RepID=UPI0006C95AA1|nr:GPI inositol-deacylase [Copidosoma floridanum]
MNLFKISVIYGIVLSVSFLVLILYVLGATRYVVKNEDNTCDMTYMFEYPQYVRISLNSENDVSEDAAYPRFKLFAYGEGFVTERLRRMHFTGIPALFIPGNAGSHEQARSLASVSLRKSLKYKTPFHFDYFSISFGKDYSGIYGGILKEQAKYTVKCIKRILSLYKGRAKNIVLIGHSMGGVIAKGALLLVPEINSNVVSILITLSTPHMPSIYPDYTFYKYYMNLESNMKTLKRNGTSVISIGGGPRDILVPSSQTVDDYADLNALTTHIPGVWRSMDHLNILWCKQFVLNVVRCLFDCVNATLRPPSITDNEDVRMMAFNWHFNQPYSIQKHIPGVIYSEKVTFPNEPSEWIEDLRRQYTWRSKDYFNDKSKKPSTIYLMISLNAPIDALSIDAVHLKTKDWIFACSASDVRGYSKVCPWGWNLSNRTKVVPDISRKPGKYSVDLDLNEIRDLRVSHVVVKVPAQRIKHFMEKDDDDDDDNQIIQIDGYMRGGRFRRVSSVAWPTDTGSLRYYVYLDRITDAVSVEFENATCYDNTQPHYAMVELIEPWTTGSRQIQFFANTDDDARVMTLQTVHSQRLHAMKTKSAEMRITLDPNCLYKIRVQRAGLIDRISCMVRDRWTLIYPIIIGFLLLTIGQRIDCNNERKTSTSVIIIVTMILCISLNLVLECFVGIAILHILAIGVCCLVVFFGSIAHKIAVRFLARAVTFSTTWSDWVLGGLVNQLPIVTAGILLSMITATCGALAMLLSIFLHFLRLTQMYEDYLEELLLATMRHFNLLKKKKNGKSESGDSIRQNIFNQILLFLFWCFTALPAVPSALVWAKNFSYSTRLASEDEVFLCSWIVMVAFGTSGLVKIPTTPINSNKTKLLSVALFFFGWMALVISATSNAAHYYWCFPPCLAVVVALLSINSLQS